MTKIRILLADDHVAILTKTRTVLGDEFDIVGTASNGREAICEVQRLDPDVLVIDIAMPELNGLQAASQLQCLNPRTKIVFLTVHEDQDFVDAAFASGASGYVIKEHLTTDLVRAIHEALAGRHYVSPFNPH